MGERRRVVVSDFLIEHAKAMFPPEGSASGSPRYEVFEDGPLAAAQRLFEHWFDEAPEAVAGIKHWITIDLPFFPPMVFYAALVDDHVELLDVTVHEPEDSWDVRGHEKVPTYGQLRSPLVATKSPRWWPAEVPTPR